MPYLSLRTNTTLGAGETEEFQHLASQRLAEALGKREQFIMVDVEGGRALSFAGSTEPTAFLQLKSIGLAETATAGLAAMLCDLVEQQLGIAPDRVYIEFQDAPRAYWGWNGKTFAG